MKIVLTGASGFLGRATHQALIQAGHQVVALGHRQAEGAVRSLDLRDTAAWRGELLAADPDVVVHCAAYRDPDFCEQEQEETSRLNIAPVRVLVDTLAPNARILFVSTDYVFDGENPPYAEDAKRHPVNFYGQSKLEGEDIVLERTGSMVLRIPLLMGCGPSFSESGFIAKTIQAIEREERTEMDDKTMRFPTDIEDVAAAICYLLQEQATGIFHFAGPEGRTQFAWAQALAALVGRHADHINPVSSPRARLATRPSNSQLSTEKLRSMGFDRSTSFTEVARRVLALSR